MQKVRDIFLWTCYTGLRFTDAQNLKQEDIRIDAEGQYWLQMEQEKTEDDIELPLIQKAIALYHKYEDERVYFKVSDSCCNTINLIYY